MNSNKDLVAVIAGQGRMPHLVMDEIHSSGGSVFLLALKDVTSESLSNKASDSVWVHCTQLGKAIKECEKRGIKNVVMAGRVRHENIFSASLFHMDWTTIKAWKSLPDKRADSLLGAVVDEFAKRGINVLDSTHYLKKYLVKQGVLTDKSPSQEIKEDIFLGQKMAKALGKLDIGQTVVVKDGAVVAVEAMEGTDLCIERAGDLAGRGCVVVKMSKPSQDMRFDVPVIGSNTIEKLVKVKASALAIEANKTLLLKHDLIDLANKAGLIIEAL